MLSLGLALLTFLSLAHGRIWRAEDYPSPHKSDGCVFLEGIVRVICDPDNLLKRDVDGEKRVSASLKRLQESDLGVGNGTEFGIVFGIVLLERCSESLPDFAAAVAKSWGLAGDDQALLVLSSSGDKQATRAALGGAMFTTTRQQIWQAALEQRIDALLLAGRLVDAVEAGLSGLLQLLGGEGLKTLPANLESHVKKTQILNVSTSFQAMDVQTNTCGQQRCNQLFLQDILQLSDRFERYYHEAMVFPALNVLGSEARRLLILGGGDAGIASLALRFASIEKVVMIEIDATVTDVSRRLFPAVSLALQDHRLQVLHEDALKWVQEHQGDEFDLIIIDFSDDPLAGLWSKVFFQNLKGLLNSKGVLVQNVGTVNAGMKELLAYHTSAFQQTWPISIDAPDYHSPYNLAFSADKLNPLDVDWNFWEQQDIPTFYYWPSLHPHLFTLPVYDMQLLASDVPRNPECPAALPREAVSDFTSGDKVSGKPIVQRRTLQNGVIRIRELPKGNPTTARPYWGKEEVSCQKTHAGNPTDCSLEVTLDESTLNDPTTTSWDEIMALPALNILGRAARRVLLVGGGDGGVASLILRYPHVEQLVVVDMDRTLLDVIIEFLPVRGAALKDPRTKIHHRDVWDGLDKIVGEFDAIIVTLDDRLWQTPSRSSRVPCSSVFLQQFKELLSPNGLLVQHMGSLALPRNALRKFAMHQAVFEQTWAMRVTTFSDTHSDKNDRQWRHAPGLLALSSRSSINPLAIDWSVWEQAAIKTAFYHPSMHHAVFVVPAELQSLLRVPSLEGGLACGPPPKIPVSPVEDGLAERSSLDLIECIDSFENAASAADFLMALTMFATIPSYGSWLHTLDSHEVFALTLLDRAFIEFRARVGGTAGSGSISLVCSSVLCTALKKRIAEALTVRLACNTSSWSEQDSIVASRSEL